jgi:hypothetical protein
MAYYVRVLSTSADRIPLAALHSTLREKGLEATLSAEVGTTDDWEQLVLSHPDGVAIASIERDRVGEGSLGAEDLAELMDEVRESRPASAAAWLLDYLRGVRCIYAFQVLGGTEHSNGWEILDAVKDRIWSAAPGIIQADQEGFSNEEGYHILWQFEDSVEGDYWMGVRTDQGWKHFQMDLGNRAQRRRFLQGQVPPGVRLA